MTHFVLLYCAVRDVHSRSGAAPICTSILNTPTFCARCVQRAHRRSAGQPLPRRIACVFAFSHSSLFFGANFVPNHADIIDNTAPWSSQRTTATFGAFSQHWSLTSRHNEKHLLEVVLEPSANIAKKRMQISALWIRAS